MTPIETEYLRLTGSALLYILIARMITWVLYGTFALVTMITSYLFLRKGMRNHSKKSLLACLVLLVLANTWNFVCESGFILTAVEFAYIKPNPVLAKNLTVINKVIQPFYTQLRWPHAIHLMINDGLVVWRACIFWPDSKLLQYMVIFLMVGNIVLNVTNAAINFPTSTEISNFALASNFVSLGVNLVATLLIAFRVWHHYRATRSLYSTQTQSSSTAFKTLLLLLESGAIFCLIQIFLDSFYMAVVYRPTVLPTITNAYEILYAIIKSTVPIYPLAVVVLTGILQSQDNDIQ